MKEEFKESNTAPMEGPRTKPTEFTKNKLATVEEMRVGFAGKPFPKERDDERTA